MNNELPLTPKWNEETSLKEIDTPKNYKSTRSPVDS